MSKKSRIKIIFKDGGNDVIPGKFWDDYEIINGYFTLTKKGRYVAGYNLNEVLCYIVDLKKKKKK